uniref:Uncharacterized protein n=1 Tax=Daphnia galeata TaxID=27404 RepID=A0A8J2RH26_9CRUS|nr:unnamed protein product [Daphnia galeata]
MAIVYPVQVLIVVFLIGVTMMETAPTPQNKRAKWKPKAIRDKEAAEAKAAEESAAKAAEEAAKGAATTIKTVEEEVKTVENKVQVDQVIAKVEDKATSHDATKVCYPAPEKESDTKIAVVSTDEQVKTTENIAADVQVTAGAIIVAEEPAAVVAEEPAVVVVADKTAAVVADEPVAIVVVEEPVAAVVAAEEPAVVVKDEPVAAVVVVDEEPIVVKAEESAAVL